MVCAVGPLFSSTVDEPRPDDTHSTVTRGLPAAGADLAVEAVGSGGGGGGGE